MLLRTCARAAAIAAVVFTARVAAGQGSVAEHIRMGDQVQGAAALRHYEMALNADSNSYVAQWKASGAAAEAGEIAPAAEQKKLYRLAERYARRAVEINARDAEGHAALARALGRTALTLGTKERVKYAGNVRSEAIEALKYNPRHSAALHIMGVWNAEIMRLNGISRFMAKNFLGGQVFGTASWKEAVSYMEQAVAVDPDRLVHRIDLAEIYADKGDKAKARSTFEYIVNAPAVQPADAKYKQQAERALKSL